MVNELIHVLETEVDYLRTYYLSSSVAAYLNDLNWIDEVEKKMEIGFFLKSETSVQYLQRIREHTMRRLQRCLVEETSSEISFLLDLITELKGKELPTTSVHSSKLA